MRAAKALRGESLELDREEGLHSPLSQYGTVVLAVNTIVQRGLIRGTGQYLRTRGDADAVCQDGPCTDAAVCRRTRGEDGGIHV